MAWYMILFAILHTVCNDQKLLKLLVQAVPETSQIVSSRGLFSDFDEKENT